MFLVAEASCCLKPTFNANDTSKTRNTGIIPLKSIMGGDRRYLKKVCASKQMVILREILINYYTVVQYLKRNSFFPKDSFRENS